MKKTIKKPLPFLEFELGGSIYEIKDWAKKPGGAWDYSKVLVVKIKASHPSILLSQHPFTMNFPIEYRKGITSFQIMKSNPDLITNQ